MKIEQTVCSETLAFKLQMPVNHPAESVQHSEHGESLKTRRIHKICFLMFHTCHNLLYPVSHNIQFGPKNLLIYFLLYLYFYKIKIKHQDTTYNT
jgi:hypothetical protein